MNETELLEKARALSGLTPRDIATQLGIPVPTHRRQAKGWLGQALETLLGATAGPRPLPDFIELGIELKTISLDQRGHPKESTFLCVSPIPNRDRSWQTSLVYRKTRKILWVPLYAPPRQAFADCPLLTAWLWQPDPITDQYLQADWAELTGLINMGHGHDITARHGQILQIRPKAAHSGIRVTTLDAAAQVHQTVPKGFYLRRQYILQWMQSAFHQGTARS